MKLIGITLIGLIAYGIAATAGYVSSAPIDVLLSAVRFVFGLGA